MTDKWSPSRAMEEYLKSIPVDFQSKLFPDLLAAATRLDAASPARAAKDVTVMAQLMGSAAFYGMDTPKVTPTFPNDHAPHLNWGTEWYYLACNLQVPGSDGRDHIGVFVDFVRSRSVSLEVQKNANWSDDDAQVVYTLATVTLATRRHNLVVRRSANAHWPIKASDMVEFNCPGDPFLFRCGADVLQSQSACVLPLTVQIDDGLAMKIELTVTSALSPDKAFFRQGADGLVSPPDPGMYYSWPQVAVTGRVTAEGETYQVSGLGWIDHQVMMKVPAKPVEPPPSPGQLFQGWSWCGFNLNDGHAFTAAGFQFGDKVEPVLVVSEGFYVQRTEDGWRPIPIIIGAVRVGGFVPMLHDVSMPTDWMWSVVERTYPLPEVELQATSWHRRCDFEADSLLVICETPVSLTSVNTGHFAGVGYCESFGYESLEAYQERALAFLKSK